jgi:hypothetical protein
MGGMACPFYHAYAADHCSTGKVRHSGYHSFSYATLRAVFNQKPPVLKLVNGSKTHWVVVYMMMGDGPSASDYKVRDSARTSSNELSYLVSLGWTPSNIHDHSRR